MSTAKLYEFKPEGFDHNGMYYAVVVHPEKWKELQEKACSKKSLIASRHDSRKRDRVEEEKSPSLRKYGDIYEIDL